MPLFFVLASIAHALTCGRGHSGANVEEVATVPPNVQFRMRVSTAGGPWPDPPELTDAAGLPVALDVVDHQAHLVATPTVPLPAGHHSLMLIGKRDPVPFEVVGVADTTAPAAVPFQFAVTSTQYSPGDLLQLSLEATLEAGAWLEVEVASRSDFSDARSGALSGVAPYFVGPSGCSLLLSPFDPVAEPYLRIRQVDLAGNVSPWTEPTPAATGSGDTAVGVGEASSSGCDMVGRGALGAWALGLMGVARRRRARAR